MMVRGCFMIMSEQRKLRVYLVAGHDFYKEEDDAATVAAYVADILLSNLFGPLWRSPVATRACCCVTL